MGASRGASGARRTVAVIGSGVSGLTAAYVLRRSHEVTLFEADPRLGGHADTHDVTTGDGRVLAVDTGFIVHNDRTYPTLLRLFAELGVTTRETDMSMSIRCDGCGLEYAGGQGLRALTRPDALRRPAYLRMLREITRFHRDARATLARDGSATREGSATRDGSATWDGSATREGSAMRESWAAGPGAPDETLAGFLARGGYSAYLRQHFVTPLVAAVWSCGPDTALEYPARYLFAFLEHHGMLSVTGSPTWRTVEGGSRTYVERAVKELTAVRAGTPVRAVRRTAGGVEVDGEPFDQVVLATHPDQALAVLVDPTPDETTTLGAFSYAPNEAVLHTDPSVLPRAAGVRASWNYRTASCDTSAAAVRVSYDMTRLQRLDTSTRYVVTLNPGDDVDPASVVDRMHYAHPRYTPESVAAQARLPQLRDGRTAFAGAYHGWGFHEDGARSGLEAALSLGGGW